MYDTLLTDLAPGHPLIDGLAAVIPYEERHRTPHVGRTLLVSQSQERCDEAVAMGMGAVHITAELTRNQIARAMSWYDDPIAEETSLFLFDLGGVVVKNITMLGSIARRFGLDRTQFFTDYFHYEFPLMEGFVSSEQYWERVAEHFDINVDDDPFAAAFKPTINDEMVNVIKGLRERGRRVVCASNTFDSHWKILEEMGVLDLFDVPYASHLLGITKPKHRFFSLILEAEAAAVQKAYFIDDSEENVSAARAMGLSSLLYKDTDVVSASARLASAFSAVL
jgi:HAD superfamily hydrolase (TIGR01509 family)